MALTLFAACGEDDPPDDPAGPTPTPTPANGDPAPTPDEPDFDAEEYFSGQTIRFITSSAPGGGTDVILRHFAQGLPEFFPGSPSFVVSHITPHVTGKNFLWASAPDGLTAGLFSTSILREQGFTEAEFTSSEFQFVGEPGDRTSVWIARGELGYQTIEDAIGAQEPVIQYVDLIPSAEDMNVQAFMFMVAADWLDLPMRFAGIPERGTEIFFLEFERGNQDVFQRGSDWFRLPVHRPGWVADGTMVPFVDTTPFGRMSPNSEFENIDAVPHIYDVLTEEQQDIWAGVFDAATAMNNPIALPPGTPQEIVDVWRQAFEDAMNEPGFAAEMERITGMPATFTTGEQLQEEAVEHERVWLEFNELESELRQEMYDRWMR